MKSILLNPRSATLVVAAALFSITSCKKDSSANNTVTDPDPIATVEAAQGDADASGQFEEVFNVSMGVQATDAGEDIGLGTGGNIIYKPADPNGILSPDSAAKCFTVTVEPKIIHQFPKTVTLDFGSGCLGKDGKLRKGKIVSIFTGPMLIPGSKASVTFVDYSVDSFAIAGTMTIQNTSLSNKQAWRSEIIDGKITNTQSGFWRKYAGVKERVQIEGNGTPLYPLDDVFQITGNANGSNSNGNVWSSTIINPVIKKFTCFWRSKGTVQINRNNNTAVAILDYGDGTCDNKATLTINGVTHIITLH
ncbi:MAG: hypothetical protein JSS98_11350 [Bacteroidetes bacterium]|nr:hypothetical protein [Bacteroidota bacterium]